MTATGIEAWRKCPKKLEHYRCDCCDKLIALPFYRLFGSKTSYKEFLGMEINNGDHLNICEDCFYDNYFSIEVVEGSLMVLAGDTTDRTCERCKEADEEEALWQLSFTKTKWGEP